MFRLKTIITEQCLNTQNNIIWLRKTHRDLVKLKNVLFLFLNLVRAQQEKSQTVTLARCNDAVTSQRRPGHELGQFQFLPSSTLFPGKKCKQLDEHL